MSDEVRVFKVYDLDLEKLQDALDAKIKRHGLTRARVGRRIGVSESALAIIQKNKTRSGIHSKTLVNVLMYLKRPITDFIVEVTPED